MMERMKNDLKYLWSVKGQILNGQYDTHHDLTRPECILCSVAALVLAAAYFCMQLFEPAVTEFLKMLNLAVAIPNRLCIFASLFCLAFSVAFLVIYVYMLRTGKDELN